MLDKKVIELLNDQINKEFYSAYLYLDIANYYTENDLDGFANWYTIQAQEERDHAMLFLRYLQSNGISVELKTIDKPGEVFSSHLAPLEVGAKHERYVTALIHTIYEAAFFTFQSGRAAATALVTLAIVMVVVVLYQALEKKVHYAN